MSRILVVEDDAMIASGLTYALEQEGYETVAVSGCASMKKHTPRAVYYGDFRHYPA